MKIRYKQISFFFVNMTIQYQPQQIIFYVNRPNWDPKQLWEFRKKKDKWCLKHYIMKKYALVIVGLDGHGT